jgi:hypothetical protein
VKSSGHYRCEKCGNTVRDWQVKRSLLGTSAQVDLMPGRIICGCDYGGEMKWMPDKRP